ncbi:hypothetical protein ACS77_19275 [Pseudomonas syringae]|uniref:Uncharacterized protein n=1 Tax=Pseudomonas syringae TaxID=317 RepID=A0A0L1M9B0_PSESX|nr:hypothetical protein ACS77_19275 [Pseudomonas syringae]
MGSPFSALKKINKNTMNLDPRNDLRCLIIAPQSLSWQPLIDDLQGAFTARLNASHLSCALIY